MTAFRKRRPSSPKKAVKKVKPEKKVKSPEINPKKKKAKTKKVKDTKASSPQKNVLVKGKTLASKLVVKMNFMFPTRKRKRNSNSKIEEDENQEATQSARKECSKTLMTPKKKTSVSQVSDGEDVEVRSPARKKVKTDTPKSEKGTPQRRLSVKSNSTRKETPVVTSIKRPYVESQLEEKKSKNRRFSSPEKSERKLVSPRKRRSLDLVIECDPAEKDIHFPVGLREDVEGLSECNNNNPDANESSNSSTMSASPPALSDMSQNTQGNDENKSDDQRSDVPFSSVIMSDHSYAAEDLTKMKLMYRRQKSESALKHSPVKACTESPRKSQRNLRKRTVSEPGVASQNGKKDGGRRDSPKKKVHRISSKDGQCVETESGGNMAPQEAALVAEGKLPSRNI